MYISLLFFDVCKCDKHRRGRVCGAVRMCVERIGPGQGQPPCTGPTELVLHSSAVSCVDTEVEG